MRGTSVLVVDDHATNVALLEHLLETVGCEVRVAESATAALAQIHRSKPRLILMDLQLPDMDGFELTHRLKSNVSTSDICIVAVTSYAMKGDERRALRAGCDGYISKPIDTRRFAAVVAKYLEPRDAAARFTSPKPERA